MILYCAPFLGEHLAHGGRGIGYPDKDQANQERNGVFQRMPNTNKILVVDDDAELRDALTEQLSLHEEFEAVAAENGTKGVQAAKAGQIDLVIMDVGLPDIDGRETVRILRKNGFKAPIIMLTGHDTDSDMILGLVSGANDYVTKPFRFAVLLRASAPSFASTSRARTRSSRSARTRFGQARSCCSIPRAARSA